MFLNLLFGSPAIAVAWLVAIEKLLRPSRRFSFTG